MHSRHQLTVLLLVLISPFLQGCVAPLSYAEVQATAQATGCWPDPYPTPRATTPTPSDGLAVTPTDLVLPGIPTATALPTLTPLPRCPAAPGATLVPWPTPVPPQPPYPTMAPARWVGGSGQQTTLDLPAKVLALDLATHPTEGWPAVASVVWSDSHAPDRVFVTVYNPQIHAWSHSRQVDLGDSQIGHYSRSVALAITPDHQVHVVWAMSDPDFRTNDPPSGVWAASSSDYGESWSAPERIASNCRRVNGLAAAQDGTLVAQLICDAGPRASVPAMVMRSPAGSWQAPERIDLPVWAYSEGSVVISGHAADTRIVSLVLAGRGIPTAYLISRPLSGGSWQVSAMAIGLPGNPDLGLHMWQVRGLAYDRHHAGGAPTPAISFLWTGADAPSGVYALTSLDGGRSWGTVEAIAMFGTSGNQALHAALAYDVAADRLVAIWTCCADAAWEWVTTTHYARWSVPGSGQWQTPGGEDAVQLVPLTLGSRSAADTVTAQAVNSRWVWLAWIETVQHIEVRSIDLNQIVPIDQYPTPSPTLPPATPGGA